MVDENSSKTWYIVKRREGYCEIVSTGQAQEQPTASDVAESWGPFDSQQEAIARRVGLIRAGKCQPK